MHASWRGGGIEVSNSRVGQTGDSFTRGQQQHNKPAIAWDLGCNTLSLFTACSYHEQQSLT